MRGERRERRGRRDRESAGTRFEFSHNSKREDASVYNGTFNTYYLPVWCCLVVFDTTHHVLSLC